MNSRAPNSYADWRDIVRSRRNPPDFELEFPIALKNDNHLGSTAVKPGLPDLKATEIYHQPFWWLHDFTRFYKEAFVWWLSVRLLHRQVNKTLQTHIQFPEEIIGNPTDSGSHKFILVTSINVPTIWPKNYTHWFCCVVFYFGYIIISVPLLKYAFQLLTHIIHGCFPVW